MPFRIEKASKAFGNLNFKKAIIPMPIEAALIVMSMRAIRMRTIFKDIKPKQTPLAIGINLKNFGSLSSSCKSPPVISKGFC